MSEAEQIIGKKQFCVNTTQKKHKKPGCKLLIFYGRSGLLTKLSSTTKNSRSPKVLEAVVNPVRSSLDCQMQLLKIETIRFHLAN